MEEQTIWIAPRHRVTEICDAAGDEHPEPWLTPPSARDELRLDAEAGCASSEATRSECSDHAPGT